MRDAVALHEDLGPLDDDDLSDRIAAYRAALKKTAPG